MDRYGLVEFLTPSYARQNLDGLGRRVAIVWARCVEGKTYRECGEPFGLTASGSRQIVSSTLSKIRRSIGSRRRDDPKLPDRLRIAMPPGLREAVFEGRW